MRESLKLILQAQQISCSMFGMIFSFQIKVADTPINEYEVPALIVIIIRLFVQKKCIISSTDEVKEM